MSTLATYTICRRPEGPGFDIRIVGFNGSRQTMLGFKTAVEAEAWIDDDMRLDAGCSSTPWEPR
jgi:hypothetical protein